MARNAHCGDWRWMLSISEACASVEHPPGVIVSTERIERAGDGKQAQVAAMEFILSRQRAREQRLGFGMLSLALQQLAFERHALRGLKIRLRVREQTIHELARFRRACWCARAPR